MDLAASPVSLDCKQEIPTSYCPKILNDTLALILNLLQTNIPKPINFAKFLHDKTLWFYLNH